MANQTYSDKILILKNKLLEGVSEKLIKLKSDVSDKELDSDINELQNQIWAEEFNLISRSYNGKVVPPIVDAGPDIISPVNTEVNISATLAVGTNKIRSIQWEQVSGILATLINSATLDLTVDDFSYGESEFKITVTDEFGLTSADIIKLSSYTENPVVYYGYIDTLTMPTYQQIVASSKVPNPSLGTPITIPFNTAYYRYMWFSEPLNQPIRIKYTDTSSPINTGPIGGSENLFKSPETIESLRIYATNYKTIQTSALTIE